MTIYKYLNSDDMTYNSIKEHQQNRKFGITISILQLVNESLALYSYKRCQTDRAGLTVPIYFKSISASCRTHNKIK